MSLARSRLAVERKEFRKCRPFGFSAKPETNDDGGVDLMKWNCLIPGPEGTPWEGGKFPVTLMFSDDYPSKPPKAIFPAGFVHPNIYPDGKVCLSILNEDEDLGGNWAPSINISEVLQGIQCLLSEPNIYSPAQQIGYELLKNDPVNYAAECRRQAKLYKDPDS